MCTPNCIAKKIADSGIKQDLNKQINKPNCIK